MGTVPEAQVSNLAPRMSLVRVMSEQIAGCCHVPEVNRLGSSSHNNEDLVERRSNEVEH